MGGRHKGERKMKAEILVTLVIKQKKKKKKWPNVFQQISRSKETGL